MRHFAATTLLCCASCLASSGCEDELGFSTNDMEVFSGEVIDADFLTARPVAVDDTLAPGTTMELNLKMRHLDTEPGRVSTSDGLFDNDELIMLPEITCDRLSSFEIQGNFIRSFIFLAPTSEPDMQGADGVLFVSLGQGEDRVEVRLLVGAGDRRRAFGVFHLTRELREDELPED